MNDDYIHQLETTVELLTNENAKLREENEALKKELKIIRLTNADGEIYQVSHKFNDISRMHMHLRFLN